MAGWLLVAALAVIIGVIVVLPDATVIVQDPPPTDTPLPAALLAEPPCPHDWRQIDELVEHDGVASVLQVCTRCTNGRFLPTTAPAVARRAGEDR